MATESNILRHRYAKLFHDRSLAPLPSLQAFGILPAMKNEYCLVLCTCPDDASAQAIATTLVAQKLAACVNIVANIRSVYAWQGKIESATELQLLIKTSTRRYAQVEEKILALHPYELPEIITVPIEAGLPGYLNWLDQSTA